MKKLLTVLVLVSSAGSALAQSVTDFNSFSLGSVNGQGGWGVSNPGFDQSVVNVGPGNNAWRVSNAVTSGSFGDMPFAPRPGGVPANSIGDPTNSNPLNFAGESSTGAAWRGFSASFDFRSFTGAAQPGARITVSPDNGNGARQGFAAIADNGSTGLDINTFDVDASGNFVALPTLMTLNYTDWHNLRFEIDFNDGPQNDVARIYINNTLVSTTNSWESFYTNSQSALHPLGVPVQTLLFRLSGTAVPGLLGGGFLIDNVNIAMVPIPPAAASAAFAMLGLGGFALLRRRR
jgi:MYXO-CTERM domain-containing protein